jgi:hypothetical protein
MSTAGGSSQLSTVNHGEMAGGTAVEAGLDLNDDGVLSSEEVTSQSLLCRDVLYDAGSVDAGPSSDGASPAACTSSGSTVGGDIQVIPRQLCLAEGSTGSICVIRDMNALTIDLRFAFVMPVDQPAIVSVPATGVVSPAGATQTCFPVKFALFAGSRAA